MLKKLLPILVLVSLLFSSLAAPHFAYAQANTSSSIGQWWFPRYDDFTNKVNNAPANEIFGERYTHAQVVWIVETIINLLTGPLAACVEAANPSDCIKGLNGGAYSGSLIQLALITDTITQTKPASGIDYIASKVQKLNVVPNAYAQTGGYGFSKSLLPVQKLWQASRNAAYALMTFAVVILAFMVMLRARLSPQTVVTIQSALPSIALALLFITFSYAIAGLMVDAAFFVQALFASILNFSGLSNRDTATLFQLMNNGTMSLFFYIFAFILETITGGGIISKLLGASHFGALLFTFVDIFLMLIVIILLFIGMARMFWLMLRTYVFVILYVVAAPFIAIMAVARPASGAISGWFRTMTAHLSVFVVIGVLIAMSNIMFFGTGNGSSQSIKDVLGVVGDTLLGDVIGSAADTYNLYGIQEIAPPDGDGGLFPTGFSFGRTQAVGFFVSLGLMLSIPGVANMIRQQIQSGRSQGFAMGEALGPLQGPATSIQRGISGGVSEKVKTVVGERLGIVKG